MPAFDVFPIRPRTFGVEAFGDRFAPGGDGDPAADSTASGTGGTVNVENAELLRRAVLAFTGFIKGEADQLLAGTREFAASFEAGDVENARSLYAKTRMHWERIEPAAEKFRELDFKLDTREADLETGEEWIGWHRAEKDLFPPDGYTALTEDERRTLAGQLVADTAELCEKINTLTFEPDELGAEAKELLDEVARRKVTGEEEAFSHTDLWDFKSNVDGAKAAFEALRPAVTHTHAALVEELEAKFAAVEAELAKYATGEGYVVYTRLSPDQVRGLAVLVDALGEPLSKLTAAVSEQDREA